MALTNVYLNTDLATGNDDGTTEANAWKTWSSAAAGYAAGDLINVKAPASRTNITAGFTLATNGAVNNRVWWRGYSSTIGDGGIAKYDISVAGQVVNWAGDHQSIEGLDFVNTGDNSSIRFAGDNTACYRVRQEGGKPIDTDGFWAKNCVFISDGGSGAFAIINNGATRPFVLLDSWIESTRTAAATVMMLNINTNLNGATIRGNVFKGVGSNTDAAIFIDIMNTALGSISISQNRFYKVNDGIYLNDLGVFGAGTRYGVAQITQNVFSEISHDCIDFNASGSNPTYEVSVLAQGNWYYSVTTAFSGLTNMVDLGNTALTASPFDNAAGDDFDLNDTAGAGAVIRAAGGMPINVPYDFANLADRAIFAGGGLIIHPGMAGGMRG